MVLSRAALSAYDARLRTLEGAAYDAASSSIAAYIEQNEGASVAQVREFAINVVSQAVSEYGDAASSLAADLYDDMALAAKKRAKSALIDTSDVSEYVSKEIRYQASKLVNGDRDGFIRACGKAASDQTSRRANQTMRVNAKRDKLRYARVPMGGDTCTFCAMLASRGFVYTSAKEAGEGNHYHARCRCKVIPGFANSSVEGYDPDEWLKIWGEFQSIDAAESLTEAEKRAAKLALTEKAAAPQAINAKARVYKGLTSGQVDQIAAAVDSMDGDAKGLYLAYEGRFKTATVVQGSDSYYSPSKRSVFVTSQTFTGQRGKEKLDTWFHELGHNIDHMSAKGAFTDRSFAYRWQNRSFPRMIKKEVNEYIKGVSKDCSGLVQRFLEQDGDADALLVLGIAGEADIEKYWDGALSAAELAAKCSKKRLKAETAEQLISADLKNRDASGDFIHSVSDLFGGVTGNKVVDTFGHWPDRKTGRPYWDKNGDMLAEEAWAEMFAGSTSAPESMALLREYLPGSCDMFKEMLAQRLEEVAF